MKVDSRILIGLGVVVVGIIVYIIIKNSNKDDEDNTKTNKAKLDRLEKALKNAGIDTLEDFSETTTATDQEDVLKNLTYTKDKLFEIVDLYFPKVRCVWEKLFDDGITRFTTKLETITLGENSDGKVTWNVNDEVDHILSTNYLAEINIGCSLVFALESDILDDWYYGFIGAVALSSDRTSVIAKYDEEHEDPYSTLVLYWDRIGSSTTEMNKNFEDYVEPESLIAKTTNEDGERVNYLKYTATIQFDRNKEKIDELKEAVGNDMYYDYMVQCNSE